MRLNIREKAVYSKGLGPREQELMKEQVKGPKEEEVSGCRYKFPCRWRQFGYSVSREVPRSVLKCETVLALLMRPQKFLDTPV